jgi:hypothetical protein
MNGKYLYGQMAAEHLGYIKRALGARAERLANGTPSLRDRFQHLADCRGVYLIGSSSLSCYKLGRGLSLRDRIGTYESYPLNLDVIMWCETPDGDEAEIQNHLLELFHTKSQKVAGTPGDWFTLSQEDLETIRSTFKFIQEELTSDATLTTFKPENFRKLTDNSKPSSIRDEEHMTLILVKATGEACYERTRTGKDELVTRFDEKNDLLLLAWTGQYKTDIFQLSADDLATCYRTITP